MKDEKFILKMHTLIKRIDKYDISYVPPKLYEGNGFTFFLGTIHLQKGRNFVPSFALLAL